jgi:hypothetical protein
MPGTDDINVGALAGEDPQKQIESIVAQANENFRMIANEDRTKITKDDAGDERLLIGFQQDGFSNGSVGIKLSQEGVKVTEATDAQLIFSSDFNLFKIIDKITGTCPSVDASAPVGNGFASTSGSNSEPHGLTYSPAFVAFINTGTGYIQTPFGSTSGGATFLGIGNQYVEVDDTNVYFNSKAIIYGNFGQSYGIGEKTVTVYILQETAA